jgi:ATP-binding cassette subfamily F protein 3
MESCDALLAAIDLFEGTVIMVTHNEMFLHTLAEKLIVFQNDQITLFDGRYQEFLEKIGWHGEKIPDSKSRSQASQSGANTKRIKKEMRRKRSAVIGRRSKTVRPIEKRITRLESDIETHEHELENLNDHMQQASQERNGTRISELSQSIHACQLAIDELFDELEKASDEMETLNTVFEQELEQLEVGQSNSELGMRKLKK